MLWTDAGASSRKPVLVRSFESVTFEEQVQELILQLNPSSPQSLRVQEKLQSAALKQIHAMIPEAQISVFVSGNISRSTAFAIAVPEVAVVVRVSPQVLIESLKRSGKATCLVLLSQLAADPEKLQKFAGRKLTDHMVKDGPFKFRRSAFSAM